MRAARAVGLLAFSVAVGAIVYYSVVPFPFDLVPDSGVIEPVGPSRLLHLLAYGGVTGLLLLALRPTTGVAVAVAVGASVLLGTGMELVQLTVPHRTASAADVATNAVASVAVGSVWRLGSRLRGLHSSQGSRMSRTSSPR
ncbi:VanZ family protein [Natronorarus salvus]|uniref:VanZ family protein n=1 Tax=Natronorarus salvus TaxID=3117733 RepID=UPI002F26B2F8